MGAASLPAVTRQKMIARWHFATQTGYPVCKKCRDV